MPLYVININWNRHNTSLIKDITLTAEYHEDELSNMESSGTDVIVSFDDGGKYIATFFSLKGLKSMLDVEERSDKWLGDQYYKILDLVVVKDFTKENLMHVIEAMEAEGDFQVIFKKL